MAGPRVEELRQALRSGSSLTPEQAQFALELIDAFESLLRDVAPLVGPDRIGQLAELIHEHRRSPLEHLINAHTRYPPR